MNYYLGQIGIYGFNFAPKGWAFCAGTILPIQQNTALFSLIGTTYGGNGTTTFCLPDLRSRTPMDFGPQTSLGEQAGVEQVTLLVTEMPLHTHTMNVNNGLAGAGQAANNVFAGGKGSTGSAISSYAPAPGNTTLAPQTVSLNGGSTPHSNIQPYLAVNFCIATTGYYPARN
jgi:microcystin-dependent protein